jgi:hypothetical protein
MVKYNQNDQKPWICNSIGYKIKNINSSSEYTGNKGKFNYADYWTKHHAAPNHQNMRKEFLTPHIILEMLRIEKQTYATRAA